MAYPSTEFLINGGIVLLILKEVFVFVKTIIGKPKREDNKVMNKRIETLERHYEQCPIQVVREKTEENTRKIEALQKQHNVFSTTITDIISQLAKLNTKIDILLGKYMAKGEK